MQHIAYIRDSATHLVEIEQLKLKPVEYNEVFIDVVDSKALNRPELIECIKILNADTTLHVQSADRLARNSVQLARHVKAIMETGALIHFHEEDLILGFDDKTAPMLKMLNCVADLESRIFTEHMLESKARVVKTKIRKKPGRKPAYSEDEILEFYRRYENGEPITEIIKGLTITANSLYRMFSNIKKQIWGKAKKSTDRLLPPTE